MLSLNFWPFLLIVIVLGLLFACGYLYWMYKRKSTELHQLNERIIRVKSELSLVLGRGDMSVWMHDLTTDTIRFLNKDFSKSDPIALTEHFKLKHPDDKAACAHAMTELLNKDKESTNVIYHYTDPDIPGGYRIVESHIYPKWEDNKLVEIIGVEHDVTQETLVRNDLELAHKKSKLATEASGIISWELNVHTAEVTLLNVPGSPAVWKMPLSKWLSFVHEEDRSKVSVAIRDLLTNTRTTAFHFDFRMLFPGSDKLQYCTIYGNALRADSGSRVATYIGFITNETRYVEMNNRLSWASRYNQIILDNVNSGLLYVDADFNVLWNNIHNVFPEKDIFSGFCQRGMIGNCFTKLGRKVRCEHCLVEECLKRKKIITREYFVDESLEVEVQLIPVWGEGQVSGAVCRVDDVTVRKKVIRDLEEARKKAEASSKLKTTFLANIGHEIRTPLNAINGFAAILDEASPEDRSAYIKIINDNSQNLIKLVENLLELSNIECGEIQFAHELVYLPTLMEYLLDFYRVQTKGNVELRAEFGEPLTIRSDVAHVQEVLENFLSNALKYTSEGVITLGYEDLGERGVKIYVRDTGMGISEENRPRVFHRFEKLGSMIPGNGLGLSICKAIVSALGGEIDYESKVGEGSTFWIILPKHS